MRGLVCMTFRSRLALEVFELKGSDPHDPIEHEANSRNVDEARRSETRVAGV